jgi:hypothetical protein
LRSEVLTAVKMLVFGVVTPSGLVGNVSEEHTASILRAESMISLSATAVYSHGNR